MQEGIRLSGIRLVLQKNALVSSIQNEYEIILFDQVLSSNTQSTCNLGLIKTTKDLVAIKKIKNRRPPTNQGQFLIFKQRYQRELKNFYQASQKYKNNQHSNIVDVYPLCMLAKNKTHAYIVMQFCKNGNLEAQLNIRRLNHKWFTFGQFYNMFKQIINGYNQLYFCQILHQNLKPANIFLNGKYLKIGNFSLSRKLNNAENQYNIHESAYYTAPDKHISNHTPSSKSDIFSLGVILFQLIYDEHPFCENKQFQSTINSRFSIKNTKMFQTKREFDEKIRNQIISKPLRSKLMPVIRVQRNQLQNLQKIKAIIERMLQKQEEKRITFLQILLQMEKIVLQNQDQLQFMNKKYIPQKFQEIIRRSSEVSIGAFHFANQKKINPNSNNGKLFMIQYNSQRINILSIFLYGIMTKIQKQIKSKKLQIEQIKQICEKLLQFNYTLTYIKYNQILNEIAQLDSQTLKQFYQCGLDSIVNNTKFNKQLLENEILQKSYNKNQIQQFISKSYSETLYDMSTFINKKFIKNHGQILDAQNVVCYLLVLLIKDLVDNKNENSSIQEIHKLILQQRQYQQRIEDTKLQIAQKRLKQAGITFAMTNLTGF